MSTQHESETDKKWKAHPLTDIVPEMSPAQLAKLEDDIFHYGQLEAIVVHKGKILDGRGRQKACEKLGIDVKYQEYTGDEDEKSLLLFIIRRNHRRDLNKSQRALIALDVEKVFAEIAKANMRAGGGDKRSKNASGGQRIDHPIRSAAQEAARICCSNRDYVFKLKTLRRENGEEIDGLFQDIRSGLLHVPDVTSLMREPASIRANALAKFNAAKIVRPGKRINLNNLIREAQRDERNRVSENLPESGERWQLIRAGFIELIDQIQPNSIDLIFADPWYHKKHLSGYEDLAKLALQVLKPGGSLLAMTGNLYLKEILNLMTPYLQHHWTFAYLMPGKHSKLYTRYIEADWKPVFWFTKGEYIGPYVTKTVVVSEEPEKDRHPYQQSLSGITALLQLFPDAKKIMDPCVGSGTTAIAALTLGRRFVGADNDQDQINCTKIEIDKLPEAATKASDLNGGHVETAINEKLSGSYDQQLDGDDMAVIGSSLFSIAA